MIKKIDKKNKFISMFNPDTGFYIRSGVIEDGKDTGVDPFMTSFPELLDIGIMQTCVCSHRCNVDCYQKASERTGKNMSVEDFVTENGYYGVPESMCPICQFIEYSEYDLSAYLLKTYGVSREEAFAEVKKFNKRRKKLYENEYITYVCKKFDLNPTEIVANWKEEFKTYNAFAKWLNT